MSWGRYEMDRMVDALDRLTAAVELIGIGATIKCPECLALVDRDDLASHISLAHPEQDGD